MSSRSFGDKSPAVPHLAKGGELADLRRDIDEAFSSLETEVDEGGGGGGVGHDIDEGAAIGGQYVGDVICRGDHSLDDDLEIFGDLIVTGTLYNNGGHNFVVHGNVTGHIFDFTPGEGTTAQGSFNVGGNFIFDVLFFPQPFSQEETSVRIGGDCIGAYGFSGSQFLVDGQNGRNGCNVYIYGSLWVDEFSQSGGSDIAESNAGDGGDLYVWGTMRVQDYYSEGGDATYPGGAGGNGGYLEVRGAFTGSVTMNGGNSSDSHGGDGGEASFDSSAAIYQFEADGGDSSSAVDDRKAGDAGSLYAFGDITAGSIYASGGSRYGATTAAGEASISDGGELYCYANVYAYEIRMNGGSIYCDVAVSEGGHGGQIDVYENLGIDYSIEINGGDSALGGGRAGYIYCGAFLTAEIIYMSGGAGGAEGGSNENGSPDSLEAEAGLVVGTLTMLDGDGEGASGATRSFSLNLIGNCTIGTLHMADRDGSHVRGVGTATLQLFSLPEKKTLTQDDSSETGDISSYLASGSIFTYVLGVGWFVIEGVSLAE